MKTLPALAVALALPLAGCAETLQERLAVASEACEAYGFERATVGFSACLMHVDQERQGRQAMQEAAAWSDLAAINAASAVGAGLAAQPIQRR